MSTSEKIVARLRVNDEDNEILVAPDATLVTVLRDQLGLTGTKRGCNQGVCGACTVLIDGVAARSCLTLAALAQDRDIVTVEGLRDDDLGGRVIRALVEGAAVQCGFCTPGMVAVLTELLEREAAPTLDEIREGISGNICRCTGYRKILDAMVHLAAELREARASRVAS
jgi:carbon-monoxide dehydrogenase small subunit